MSQRLIAVIDGNSLLHRAFHAVQTPMNTPDGAPTNAVFGFMQMLLKMIEDYHPDAIICAWDVHRPDWRMKLLAGYKAQRPPMDEDLAVQFPMIQGLLEAMNIPCIAMDGYEGDDILGTMAARGEANGDRVFLITGDKDAYQLASDTTSIVTTRKGMSDVVIYTPEKVVERYGIPPSLVPDFLGLKGDSSDNIPGVPGVGEKTAAKLLVQWGSLDDVLEHADDIKGKMGERIREHAEDARISRAVATIRRDAPVELSLDDVHFPSYSAQEVSEAFGALHFNRHLRVVLSLLGDDVSTAAAMPQPKVKLSYHVSQNAESFVKAAVKAGRRVAVALDEPIEQSLFAQEPTVVFSDGAGLAETTIELAAPLIGHILAEGTLVGIDIKRMLRGVFAPGHPARELDTIFSASLFDCSLAAYLLDSNGSYLTSELAEKYLDLVKPTGQNAPSDGQFEAAVAESLVDVLTTKLKEDDSWNLYCDIELKLMPVLLSMERFGTGLDTNVLKDISSEISGHIEELRAEIIGLAGEDFNIDSPKQLGHILFEVLGLDTKKSKKNRTGWSTNATVLEKLRDDHPLPDKVVEYRELTKLRSTYLDTLPTLVDRADGRIHTSFNQTVTTTGRLSSSDPNLQNIPVRTELGRRIREAFVAPPDGVFLSADYSQIELRLLAHLSGDEGLIDAFLSGEDFHAHTASDVFGVSVDEVTPDMRSRAKAVNFGIVYGQQAFGLGQTLHIPMTEAQEMIDRYYDAYPKVRAYLDDVVAQAHKDGYATTMFGRKRHIPELRSTNVNLRHFGERTAMNHPMQGTAADIIKLAMIQVNKRRREEGLHARMVLQVHDELDFECPNEEADTMAALVAEVMNNVVELKVPLIADVQMGPNWAIAH